MIRFKNAQRFKEGQIVPVIKKLFGGIDLTWKRLLAFAVLAGVYTGIMAMLPSAKDTSFADITISFEVWILFGILIIMNSSSPKDSALKCFVFFLVSQPLVYLIQVPFSELGWGLFGFYRYWFIWTLLTVPMGFFGYYMKQNKWWGLLILTPILLLLGVHYSQFLAKTLYFPPHHLLSAIFCFITLLLYPIAIFDDKKIKTAGAVISIVIITAASILSFVNRNTYRTTPLVNGGSAGAVFDDSYKVYLEDESFGRVSIDYQSALEDYIVNAEFTRGGQTNLILEAPDGSKTVYELNIGYDTFDIKAAD
jgi:hypothetical protein